MNDPPSPLALSHERNKCKPLNITTFLILYQTTNLYASKLKDFADDNFEFDEMMKSSRKGYKTLWENEKLLVTSNVSFSHSVFKRLVL